MAVKALRDSTLKTARAWAIKEFAMSLWHYASKTWARKGWERWLSWAVRSGLEPIKKVCGNNQGSSVGNIERCCF
ncbi:transposase [Candidatus Vondammii sp. HM_W22]|uniref:transposase n=1 Tax=Candidatus Vondammii sp. HM_W22 TaxID=2687299 RepID=UPI00403DA993